LPQGQKAEYLGFEYVVSGLGGANRWEWAFYPNGKDCPPKRGKVFGTIEAAEASCKSEIDAWYCANRSN